MATFKQTLANRTPSTGQALTVFSCIVFVVFTWTLYHMFWQVPSWLYYLNIGNVFTVTAYVLSFCLIESAVVFAFLYLFSLLFSAGLFKEKFIAQGSVQVLLISIIAIKVQEKINLFPKFETWTLIAIPLGLLIAMTLVVFIFSKLFDRFPVISRLLSDIANRMTIFSYIYLPFSLVSLAVVLLRNIF